LKLVLRKGQEEEIRALTACGGCDERATPHHKCDKCKKNMHVECGRIIGELNDRCPVRCPSCDGKKDVATTPAKASTATGTQQSVEPSSLTTCGGCGKETGPVHKCDKCHRHMHPFCGRTIGEEGYGAPVRCPACDKEK